MSGQAVTMTNGTAAPFNWGKFFSLDNKWIAPMFITTILVVGNLSFGMLESCKKTGIAIVASLITELILSKIYFGKWPILASAYISGISVGILVRSPAVWPYFVCAVVSIMSKYVLRVNNRHIWNPSNFGIAVLVFLAPETVATLILGSVIIARLKRFHITGTYVACFIALAFVRSWITGSPWQSEVAPLTGPMYQLFIFFMITDPKTTVKSKKWQAIVVAIVAVAEMILRLDQVVYAPFYALFLVGPTALLIEYWFESRSQKIVSVARATA
jgi:hypothetical protein